jgi:hypothetical protein
MGLMAQWLPIIVSAVIVFIASSIIHMLPLWHKTDFPKMPNEDKVMDALRPLNVPPGDYMVPRPASMADMKSPAFIEKINKGPVFTMTVFPSGPMKMGPTLAMWFVYCCVVSVFAAYLTGRTLRPEDASYLQIHRVAGCTAFAGYSLALLQGSIWYKRAWSFTIKTMFDGLIYGMLTGGTFGWLWHHLG